MPSYPAGFTTSDHALITPADALRRRRRRVGARWRRLSVGRQALLVAAHLHRSETCTDKIRCCPWRAIDLVKAVLVLILAD